MKEASSVQKNKEAIAVSSRVRLARNLAGYPFPGRLSKDGAVEVAAQIRNAVLADQDGDWLALELNTLDAPGRLALAERHLMSREMVDLLHAGWLLIRRDESLGLMINEEDHVRIQSLAPAFDLETSYAGAKVLADVLESRLDIARSDRLGYLTACPTNTGSGMRASVMLHLPALGRNGAVPALLSSLARSGCALRGFNGEGSNADGDLYQVSNQVTLGRTDSRILRDLTDIIDQIVAGEAAARQNQYRDHRLGTEDRVCRSLGTLLYARRMSYREAMGELSRVREGIALGILPVKLRAAVEKLTMMIGPASIEWQRGSEMDENARDEARAELIRNILGEDYLHV